MNKTIDLNCDLGEWRYEYSAESDRAIMPYITSCNIACGGHIGDQTSMSETIELAMENGVEIGAHPSYPDKVNFGRNVLDISPEKLFRSLQDQINSLSQLVEKAGKTLHHVKPHGALYNKASRDQDTAQIIVDVIKSVNQNLPVYLPPNSVSKKIAEESGLKVVTEVFADRSYEDDYSLRSRTLDGAVLENQDIVIEQIRSMVLNGTVKTYSGQILEIPAETICLHSDTPGSAELAKTINKFLEGQDVRIAAP